jgi:ankyrin repeat protein
MIKHLFHRSYIPCVPLPLEVMIFCNQNQNIFTIADGNQYPDTKELYAKLIEEATPNVDMPGFDKVTNLQLACDSGDLNLASALLTYGANPNQKFGNSCLPVDLATVKGYGSIVKLLIQFGAHYKLPDNEESQPNESERIKLSS